MTTDLNVILTWCMLIDGLAFDKKVLCQKLLPLKDHASIIPSGQSCQMNPATHWYKKKKKTLFPLLTREMLYWEHAPSFLSFSLISRMHQCEEKLGNKLMLKYCKREMSWIWSSWDIALMWRTCGPVLLGKWARDK